MSVWITHASKKMFALSNIFFLINFCELETAKASNLTKIYIVAAFEHLSHPPRALSARIWALTAPHPPDSDAALPASPLLSSVAWVKI